MLPENRGQDDLQYQPIIGIDLVGSLPGRVRDVLSVDLHTSVTSRFTLLRHEKPAVHFDFYFNYGPFAHGFLGVSFWFCEI